MKIGSQSALKRFIPLFLSILAGLLLALPFCNGKLWLFAWFGFVPLFLSIQHKSRIRAFLFSYLTGIVFWSITIYWLIHVTLLGQILLISYLALYFGLFGLFAARPPLTCSGRQASPVARSFFGLLYLPSIWAILEYLRSHLLTGFGWALLGYSQYLNLPVIQIADIFGTYGVSFLVMMVNILIYSVIRIPYTVFRVRVKCLSGIFLLFIALAYGYWRINGIRTTEYGRRLKVSVIQGNIPQELKWAYGSEPFILERYAKLTELASQDRPDLIIWPEASNPGFIGEGKDNWMTQAIFSLAKETNAPLLFGSAVRQEEKYFNSALLIGAQGEASARYDKLHLVPFGEYIPLKKFFPFLETIVPIGDFTPGKEYTLFQLSPKRLSLPAGSQAISAKFAVLICFEDTIPELSRNFVRKGADFLVNITNDAWFGRSWAAYQHLSASVFRAIENRVPLVRSANTGISCFIDASGKIAYTVSENGRDIFVPGFKTAAVALEKRKSLYPAIGDMFVGGCLAMAACCGIIIKLR